MVSKDFDNIILFNFYRNIFVLNLKKLLIQDLKMESRVLKKLLNYLIG